MADIIKIGTIPVADCCGVVYCSNEGCPDEGLCGSCRKAWLGDVLDECRRVLEANLDVLRGLPNR